MTETAELTQNQRRWAILQRKVQGQRVAAIFRLFRDNDIEPILIKGFAADRHYPVEVFRPSIDVDLTVAADDFEKADKLAASPEASGFAIDIHRELRHLDTVDWNDLFENTWLIDVEGSKIRVLRPEDHLRVMAVHWLNDGGINREKLWDIYYAVTNREPDFDWQRALGIADEKRRTWVECTILLAHRYLGLDIEQIPLKIGVDALPKWLTKSIERSWAKPPKEIPLWLLTRQPVEFANQLRLRLSPNPVRATIEMDESFDHRTRFFIRVRNFFWRVSPSLRRNLGASARETQARA